jgi:hypothetical protein
MRRISDLVHRLPRTRGVGLALFKRERDRLLRMYLVLGHEDAWTLANAEARRRWPVT